MKILIDATNLRSGGGLTHLSNILKYVDPLLSSVTEIVVIGSKLTLSKIEDRDFIKKIHYPVFEKQLMGPIKLERLPSLAVNGLHIILFISQREN